jgi:hypothetical protein
LTALTTKQLRDICTRWNVRAAARKSDIIENILSKVKLQHVALSNEQEMRRALTERAFKGNGPLHESYKDNFNLVDLIDRQWNAVEEHHHHRDWKTKYLLLILRLSVHNAMVHSKIAFGKEWLQYRTDLAKTLLNL